ncbi:MAG: alpha-glucan family phosphorylase, partial [Phycisphaerae bacterium]|nr:alpha-glucan family phosphorylase [Phycisphaerae bacterium]
MTHVRRFNVLPSLPEPLLPLRDLARNLWWTWEADAAELFRQIDIDLWEQVSHNPARLLSRVRQERLERLGRDPAYLAFMERVLERHQDYMKAQTWFSRDHGDRDYGTIAYFSAEFGLHECLPIYSGGLGILAGDHLKSASDIGLPLVGIGLLYRQGYFHQYLTNDGYQFEDYPDLDFGMLPITLMRQDDGIPKEVQVEIGRHTVMAQIWQVQVGRVMLYLLDANIAENRPEDREITARLYGGDQEMRIRQEILLGIGGVRALTALGIDPSVCHMNEGHSAFLSLERIRQRMNNDGLSFQEAREVVGASTVFTTHTPVPAGIDTFPPDLVEKYLGPYCNAMRLSIKDLLALSRMNPVDAQEPFSMAVLALRMAHHTNGVSRLHGEVSREIFARVWPGVPVPEVPITSVTNGVHVRSWLSVEMAHLFDRYLGPTWADNPVDHTIWNGVDNIPDAELWRSHERLRERLVVDARRRLKTQLRSRGAPPTEVDQADEVLDPEALTIGFARRFAPYKRAALIIRDTERLLKLVNDTVRPLQFVFAGKAHPNDEYGKELLKKLIQFMKDAQVRHRMVFLEDYDMSVARSLVQGVDVWLNTPMKRHEASGTSGMKVPPNGGINLSVLDGWWPEAYDGSNGWVIGDQRIYNNSDYQDFFESQSLYELLEKEIIPLFYDRGSDGLPRRWIAKMKASMRSVTSVFNTNRMVREYADRMYLPAAKQWQALRQDNFTPARDLAAWRTRLQQQWGDLRIESVSAEMPRELVVGQDVPVVAEVFLGSLSPDDLAVEL